MWLFWIVWACVCAAWASICARACTYTQTWCAYVLTRTPVFVCLCRSIKFCSHSCRLVSARLWSVCLPLNLQPLLLFHSLSSFLPLVFHLYGSVLARLCCSLFSSSLLPRSFFLCIIFLPHSLNALSIHSSELPQRFCFSFVFLWIYCFHLAVWLLLDPLQKVTEQN